MANAGSGLADGYGNIRGLAFRALDVAEQSRQIQITVIYSDVRIAVIMDHQHSLSYKKYNGAEIP